MISPLITARSAAVHVAGEVEAEVCIAVVDADGASREGLTHVSPAVRPAGSQHQYRGQGHPGCSDPPGDAPAGDSFTIDSGMSIPPIVWTRRQRTWGWTMQLALEGPRAAQQ